MNGRMRICPGEGASVPVVGPWVTAGNAIVADVVRAFWKHFIQDYLTGNPCSQAGCDVQMLKLSSPQREPEN